MIAKVTGFALVGMMALSAVSATLDASGVCEGQKWNVYATNDSARIVICNVNHDLHAKGIACSWTVYRDGRLVAKGKFSLLGGRRGNESLGPGQSKVLPMPPIVKELRQKGGEISLRVRFAKDGGEVTSEQIDFPRLVPAEPLPTCAKKSEMAEDARSYTFSANDITYAFCRKTGMLYSIQTGWLSKTEWLKEPMQVWMPGKCSEMTCVNAEFSDVTNGAFSVVSRWKAKSEVDDGGELVVAARWTARGDGALVCQSEASWDGKPIKDDRFGYRLTLGMDQLLVEYFGVGSDAFLGRYCANSGEGFASKSVRSVSFDAGWDHLSLTTCGEPFSFEMNACSPVEKMAFGVHAESRGLDFVIRPEKAEGSVSVPTVKLPAIRKHSIVARANVMACTSREPGVGEAENVIDGDAQSIWLTQQEKTMGKFPHAIMVDLGCEVTAKGVKFLGRTDGSTLGRVKGYNFEVSRDGVKWTRELEGELKDTVNWQEVSFVAPVKMRYWRFTATSGHYKTDAASMAEIEIVK